MPKYNYTVITRLRLLPKLRCRRFPTVSVSKNDGKLPGLSLCSSGRHSLHSRQVESAMLGLCGVIKVLVRRERCEKCHRCKYERPSVPTSGIVTETPRRLASDFL
eukprot:6473719-Amphidinium_carterae.1